MFDHCHFENIENMDKIHLNSTYRSMVLPLRKRGVLRKFSSHILVFALLPESSTTASPPILLVSCFLPWMDCRATNTKLLRIQDKTKTKSQPVHVPGIGCFLGTSLERTNVGFAALQTSKLVCKTSPQYNLYHLNKQICILA